MRQLSRLSVIVALFSISVLMASCSAPMKTAKQTLQGSGEVQKAGESESSTGSTVKRKKEPLTAQNHELIHSRIEQRLDDMDMALKRIEQVLGLNGAEEQLPSSGSENSGTDSKSMAQASADGDEGPESDGAIEESDTPEQLLQPEESSEDATDSTLSPKVLYSKGQRLLLDRQFKAAEESFKVLAQRYPDHPLAVNALYWMGECRYSVRDYRGSITIFKQLVEKYPKGRKVPDALLKTAYAYLSINDIDNGREYLKKVVRQFPFSPAGEKAEKRLQTLR